MKTFMLSVSLAILILSTTIPADLIKLSQPNENGPVTIIDQTNNSITLSIIPDNISLDDVSHNGENYKRVRMKEWGRLSTTGKPYLPYKGIKLITAMDPNITFSILSEESEIFEDILVYPTEEASFAAVGIDQGDLYRKDEDIYSKDAFYPSSPIMHIETHDQNSIPVSLLGIVPAIHNPLKKQLKVYKKLVVKVTFESYKSSIRLRKNTIKTLKNCVVNPEALSSNSRFFPNSDFSDDILIITSTKYREAADTLATWQRKKGYDVKIVDRTYWTTGGIDSEVKYFYNNATVKPGYLLIIGDQADVPGKSYKSLFQGYGHDNFISDHYYTCMGSSDDYVAEMARGRISVKSASEAMTVVKKIIKYETTPPSKSSFYENTLACGYYQDKNYDGYADRRFAQTAEEVKNYLSPLNIKSKRIYFAESYTYPKRWNNTLYSWGEPVPDHLKKPTFPWNGNKNHIANGMNDGVFLIYHYDHGWVNGWGDPEFSSTHAKNLLSNNDLLPVIYSIDCLVGKFNHTADCFAEVITKLDNGGAVGIVAATTLSSSGNNEALLDGMIDATWPGLILKTPNKGKNPVVTEHEPIYTMGDIMNQGFIRMAETWSRNNSYHAAMYHYFGDPTTPLWTKEPIDISGTYDSTINMNSDIFKLSNLNVKNGIATLYDLKNDTVVGKIEIDSSGSTEIPITYKTFTEQDTLQLTIVSHNYIPKISKILVEGGPVPLSQSTKISEAAFRVNGTKLYLNIPKDNEAVFTLHDLKGRRIYKEKISSNSSSYLIDFANSGISSGHYIIRGRIGSLQFERSINIMN